MGHGDTQQVILLPGSVNECFEFGWRAFDIAERLQTPVFVLSDLDFGMNQWMTEPFKYPETPIDRGKVLWEEDLEKLKARLGALPGYRRRRHRLPHPARQPPPKAAYFTRGTGHSDDARYSEDPQVWHDNLITIEEEVRNRPLLRTCAGDRICRKAPAWASSPSARPQPPSMKPATS